MMEPAFMSVIWPILLYLSGIYYKLHKASGSFQEKEENQERRNDRKSSRHGWSPMVDVNAFFCLKESGLTGLDT